MLSPSFAEPGCCCHHSSVKVNNNTYNDDDDAPFVTSQKPPFLCVDLSPCSVAWSKQSKKMNLIGNRAAICSVKTVMHTGKVHFAE